MAMIRNKYHSHIAAIGEDKTQDAFSNSGANAQFLACEVQIPLVSNNPAEGGAGCA